MTGLKIKQHINRYKHACALYTLTVLAACTPGKQLPAPDRPVQVDYCMPAVAYSYKLLTAPLEGDRLDSVLRHSPGLGRYSLHSLLVANATGILPQLQALQQMTGDTTVAARLNRLELQQRISSRLQLAATELDALSAELDCEGEKADQLAGYLDNLNNKRVKKLTLASIILGSVTTVLTVAIKNNTAQNITGISGGVISAGLGAMAAFPMRKKLQVSHERNLLKDIWYNNDSSTVYPPFIWYMLREKGFSNSGEHAIAYNIKECWKTYSLDNSSDTTAAGLLFGKGGRYNADELHTRANMLNQLQASIRSFHQDLQALQLSLQQ